MYVSFIIIVIETKDYRLSMYIHLVGQQSFPTASVNPGTKAILIYYYTCRYVLEYDSLCSSHV